MRKKMKKVLGFVMVAFVVLSAGGMNSFAAKSKASLNSAQAGKQELFYSRNCVVEFANWLEQYHPTCNQIPYVKDIYGYNWCARFAMYCVGDQNLMNKKIDGSIVANSCTLLRNYYRDEKGTFHSRDEIYMPQKSDLIFFDKDGNKSDMEHVGIVVNVYGDVNDYTIETVEGNVYSGESAGSDYYRCTNSRVQRMTYNSNDDYFKEIFGGYAECYSKYTMSRAIYGDLNGDEKIDTRDASLITSYYNANRANSPMDIIALLPTNKCAKTFLHSLDPNCDGYTDTRDADCVLAYYLLNR